MKRFLSVITALCLLFTICSPAFASDAAFVPAEPEDYGDPIQVTTFYDEELEATITQCTYFVPTTSANSTTYDGKSGEGWYKNVDSFVWNSGAKTTYYVKGYFKWGNGKSEVSNASGGYDFIPPEYSQRMEKTETGKGQYGFIFNHYSYATYTVSVTEPRTGLPKTFTVTIRVSESGNTI